MTSNQSILIDLSSWYKDSLAPKIELIRCAIDTYREVSFTYYSPGGETIRKVEPYYLIFRWSSWYLWGWCKIREDFRLFKLNRMDKLQLTDKTFSPRSAPFPDLKNERLFPGGIKVKALFEPGCKWRLVEKFGIHCFEEQPDGKLLLHADYTDKENLITWLLTFRDQVLLLEPESIQTELQSALKNTLTRYEENETKNIRRY